MKSSPETIELEALKGLSVKQLQVLWQERARHKRKARLREPPKVGALLIRDLAWWAQQSGRRGLDAETQGLINAALKQAEESAMKPRGDRSSKKRIAKPRKSQLQPGVTLVRKWRGKTYKVKVFEDAKRKKRYEFAGQEYRSLTTIAQEITGAHWSGPRFFGLNKVEVG